MLTKAVVLHTCDSQRLGLKFCHHLVQDILVKTQKCGAVVSARAACWYSIWPRSGLNCLHVKSNVPLPYSGNRTLCRLQAQSSLVVQGQARAPLMIPMLVLTGPTSSCVGAFRGFESTSRRSSLLMSRPDSCAPTSCVPLTRAPERCSEK